MNVEKIFKFSALRIGGNRISSRILTDSLDSQARLFLII